MHTGWNYVVLAVASVVDFYSWRISYRLCWHGRMRRKAFGMRLSGAKIPPSSRIFLEDSAALVGAFLAFVGIFLGSVLRIPYLDPAASILIGVLLACVAVLLGRESGALLVGERTNRKRIKRIQTGNRAGGGGGSGRRSADHAAWLRPSVAYR